MPEGAGLRIEHPSSRDSLIDYRLRGLPKPCLACQPQLFPMLDDQQPRVDAALNRKITHKLLDEYKEMHLFRIGVQSRV